VTFSGSEARLIQGADLLSLSRAACFLNKFLYFLNSSMWNVSLSAEVSRCTGNPSSSFDRHLFFQRNGFHFITAR